MKPSALGRSVVAATAAVTPAGLLAGDAGGAPVGLVREIPMEDNVSGIAAGPEAAGKITEFRLGLHKRSQPESLVAAGGRLWFIDRETDSIGMVAPSRAPANTFLPLSPRTPRRGKATRLPVVLPGPGKLRVRELGLHRRRGKPVRLPGLRTIAVRARRCGRTVVRLVPRGAVRQRLRKRGALRITFTLRDGSAFSRRATVRLRARGSRGGAK